jgi:hypothetical protein
VGGLSGCGAFFVSVGPSAARQIVAGAIRTPARVGWVWVHTSEAAGAIAGARLRIWATPAGPVPLDPGFNRVEDLGMPLLPVVGQTGAAGVAARAVLLSGVHMSHLIYLGVVVPEEYQQLVVRVDNFGSGTLRVSGTIAWETVADG